MALTPEQRKLRGEIAAHARWSREDPGPAAARAQAGFLAKFEREVNPHNTLPRAEHARRAHMKRLALRSSQSRRKAADARRRAAEWDTDAAAADAELDSGGPGDAA